MRRRRPSGTDPLWGDRSCTECGYDLLTAVPGILPSTLQFEGNRWSAVLGRPSAAHPPLPGRPTVTEHARHLCGLTVRILGGWGLPANPVPSGPSEFVAVALRSNIIAIAAALSHRPASEWMRARDDGTTDLALARYLKHELEHHLAEATASDRAGADRGADRAAADRAPAQAFSSTSTW